MEFYTNFIGNKILKFNNFLTPGMIQKISFLLIFTMICTCFMIQKIPVFWNFIANKISIKFWWNSVVWFVSPGWSELAGIWETSGGIRRHLGGSWEAYGKCLGGIWEAAGKHLGSVWEASGKHMASAMMVWLGLGVQVLHAYIDIILKVILWLKPSSQAGGVPLCRRH